MFRNAEHYADPTAGAAEKNMTQGARAKARAYSKKETATMNAGKRFEADWKASVPKDVWYYRLRDSPGTFYGGAQDGVRFTADNICDCLLYSYPLLCLTELKTTDKRSAPLADMFGRYDPEKRRYKKQKHLEAMAAAAQHPGAVSVVVINYRHTGHTYAVSAANVLGFIDGAIWGTEPKSISESWCEGAGIRIPQRQLKVNWRYDLGVLIRALREKEAIKWRTN